jgi:hypothetical protein
VDINVFVEPERIDLLLQVLQRNGVQVDPVKARVEGLSDGVFFCWAGSTRIDVFLPSIELSWEALRTRVSIAVQGTPTWFLSTELLCCFKLLFFRPKDVVDLERLVPSAAALDVARVRALIAEAMGEEDHRVTTWDDIVRRCAPARP